MSTRIAPAAGGLLTGGEERASQGLGGLQVKMELCPELCGQIEDKPVLEERAKSIPVLLSKALNLLVRSDVSHTLQMRKGFRFLSLSKYGLIPTVFFSKNNLHVPLVAGLARIPPGKGLLPSQSCCILQSPSAGRCKTTFVFRKDK